MFDNFITPKAITILLISLVSSVYDLKIRRIPNWLTFGSFFLVLIFNITTLNFHNVLNCILGFLLGIALLIVPYAMGGMGAGDVKLLGAIGSVVGYKEILWVFFYSSIAGLVLGIIWIILKPGHLKFIFVTGKILPPVDKKQKVPYGVAIMFGCIFYLIYGSATFLLFR